MIVETDSLCIWHIVEMHRDNVSLVFCTSVLENCPACILLKNNYLALNTLRGKIRMTKPFWKICKKLVVFGIGKIVKNVRKTPSALMNCSKSILILGTNTGGGSGKVKIKLQDSSLAEWSVELIKSRETNFMKVTLINCNM